MLVSVTGLAKNDVQHLLVVEDSLVHPLTCLFSHQIVIEPLL